MIDFDEEAKIKAFYDNVYHNNISSESDPSRYHLRLAKKLEIGQSSKVLDVACGSGGFLAACSARGAEISGVDISDTAINACKVRLPQGEFHACSAEKLPFPNDHFDVITCLGSLEHFIDPVRALKEMVRVGKSTASFLLLVPNKDFLTRKLGLYGGTYQVEAKEIVRTLDEWNRIFESAGLAVGKRWKDLHVLSWSWIMQGSWYHAPLRGLQAIALIFWPLQWQYQVYHFAKAK